MNYCPPYRIEQGKIFEFHTEHNAYLYMPSKLQLSKEEYQEIQRQNALYEAKYDKWKKEQL